MIFRKSLISPFLTHRLKCAIISHKFYFGQGGELQFDLTKRNYNISIETIWEDYSSLEIQGLTGTSNFTLYEQEGISYFRDEELQSNLKENIEVKLKIPEDYTIRGKVNGNITHGSGPVGKKMRSKPFALELLGENREMALGDLKSEQVSLINREGTITAPNLTVQAGSIQSKIFKSQKLMTSGSISVNCLSMITRSIIMFGKSNGTFTSRDIEIESISGASHINSDGNLKIQRYYGGKNDINIKCKGIKDKVGIQSGTGKVQFPSEEDARQGEKKVVLGRMHKGKLERQGNVILIC